MATLPLQIVSKDNPITEEPQEQVGDPARGRSFSWWIWVSGAILVVVTGTWLVWFSAYVQRKFQEEDIRAACHRVMPETADRCFDTVVIQRGGVRR